MVTAKTTRVQTLIIGGGITGLATAYALKEHGQHDYLVLEAQDYLGGLCATTHRNGYYFDYSGHLLHLHSELGQTLIHKLLGSNLQSHKRRAHIYTQGLRVPYPFQTNVWALSPHLQEKIVAELTQPSPNATTPHTFAQWCIQSFGPTLYETFFQPYNEKLWGRSPAQLTCDWCGPFVPAPHRQEILTGARLQPTTPQGYNATFYYPKHGGCGALIEALAEQVSHRQTNAPVTRIDLTTKTAWVNDHPIRFEQLVSTIPLPQLVHLLDEHAKLKHMARQLEAQPVTVYHLAVDRKVEPFSWIYCPDPQQPFYRVGLTSSFTPDSVPNDHISLFYIELPGKVPPSADIEARIWSGMRQLGLVTDKDQKVFTAWQTIPCAYVIFNNQRAQVVPTLLRTLEEEHCFCAGRYGRWEYSFMEKSLTQAWELAQRLVKLV